MSQTTMDGSGNARVSTKSMRSSTTWSRSSFVRLAILVSKRAMALGANAPLISLRSVVWCGGSISVIIPSIETSLPSIFGRRWSGVIRKTSDANVLWSATTLCTSG